MSDRIFNSDDVEQIYKSMQNLVDGIDLSEDVDGNMVTIDDLINIKHKHWSAASLPTEVVDGANLEKRGVMKVGLPPQQGCVDTRMHIIVYNLGPNYLAVRDGYDRRVVSILDEHLMKVNCAKDYWQNDADLAHLAWKRDKQGIEWEADDKVVEEAFKNFEETARTEFNTEQVSKTI